MIFFFCPAPDLYPRIRIPSVSGRVGYLYLLTDLPDLYLPAYT